MSEHVCISLHQTQARFVDCNATLRGYVGGIGSGKSWVGAYDLLAKAQPGCLYAVIAPTYPMLRDASLRTFMEIAKQLCVLKPDGFHRTEMRAELSNGAEVLFRSGDDPERLRGPNLSGCWLDEASGMAEEVYNVMIGRLREGGRQGWLTATFTPKGKSHWTYRVFGEGRGGAVLLHTHTSANPFLPDKFAEKLAEQYSPMRARQELGGEFVAVEGAEWPPEWFEHTNQHPLWFDEWPVSHRGTKVIALDSSKGKGGKSDDYSAFVLVQWTDGLLWVDADLDNARNSSVIAAQAVELQRTWAPHAFVVEEEFGGDVLAADIGRRAEEQKIIIPLLGIGTGGVPKEVRIRRLTPYLGRNMLRFKAGSAGANLVVQQLQEFPHGLHDDGCDALEMAIRHLETVVSGQW